MNKILYLGILGSIAYLYYKNTKKDIIDGGDINNGGTGGGNWWRWEKTPKERAEEEGMIKGTTIGSGVNARVEAGAEITEGTTGGFAIQGNRSDKKYGKPAALLYPNRFKGALTDPTQTSGSYQIGNNRRFVANAPIRQAGDASDILTAKNDDSTVVFADNSANLNGTREAIIKIDV